MKKLFSKLFIVGALGAFMMSCGDDDNEIIAPITPEDEFDARINNNSFDSLTATVFASDITDGEINVLLSFTSSETMRRIYTTQNLLGQGDEKVDASDAFGVNDKGDGSIDLASANANDFGFELTFSTAGLPSEGTLVYTFWATSGKGDFRNNEKRRVEGPAVLTINLGGSNPATQLKTAEDVRLFAPTADLMSNSFVSTADGEVYALNDSENADLWDVGYSAQGNSPQLTSAFGSPQRFIVDGDNISFLELIALTNGDEAAEDLNMVYFMDIADDFDFDGATNSSALESLTVSESDPQTIDIPTDADGDIIAFIDQYGKKGVIRIDILEDNGDDNYFESNDYVQIDIKVQP